MNVAIIDIGSNSARLMISYPDGRVRKFVEITKLAKDMGDDKILKCEAVERTFSAVSFFIKKAKEENVDKIFAFATAAVRTASNKEYFVNEFYKRFGVLLDVVCGDEEALLGLSGAVRGCNGGVIDVGGASSEVIAKLNGQVVYQKSLPFGCVNTTDKFGQDDLSTSKFCKELCKEYGYIPKTEYYCIGGTGTTIAAMLLGLETYDPDKVHGYKVYYKDLLALKNKLYALSIPERAKINGLQKGREEVISSGMNIVLAIMKKIGIDHVTISESDNLEGYLFNILK